MGPKSKKKNVTQLSSEQAKSFEGLDRERASRRPPAFPNSIYGGIEQAGLDLTPDQRTLTSVKLKVKINFRTSLSLFGKIGQSY